MRLWSYFYFPSPKRVLGLWKAPEAVEQAGTGKGCRRQWERSERKNNLALQSQFCPPLSKGFRWKQSKKQIVSHSGCSPVIWKLGQLLCSTSVFLPVEWAASLRFLSSEILKSPGVFRFQVLLSAQAWWPFGQQKTGPLWGSEECAQRKPPNPSCSSSTHCVPTLCPPLWNRQRGRNRILPSIKDSPCSFWKHRSTQKNKAQPMKNWEKKS